MRLFKTNRWATLTLAVWFGGLYCFFGCEMRVQAVSKPAAAAEHPHGQLPEAAAHNSCTDGCCKKKSGSEPAEHSHPGSEMACCRALSTVAAEKSKPPRLAQGVVAAADAEPVPLSSAPSLAPRGTHLADSSGTYLFHHVLRI